MSFDHRAGSGNANRPVAPSDDAHADADLRAAAMATSRSILSAQARAERELSAARDALQRQNAALSQTLALLQATMEATPVGVLAADRHGAVTMHNRRMAQLWNIDPALLATGRLADLAPSLASKPGGDADLAAWMEQVQGAPDRPHTLQCESADGRHLECQAIPLRTRDECIGVVYNWLDVTERMEAARLRSDALAAQMANRAKSAFMSRASHELRTPLNAVLGFSQLLEMDPAMAGHPRARGYVGHIVSAGRHLLALMDDLLQVSNIEAGALTLRPTGVDLAVMMADAVALCEPLAAPRAVRLASGGDAGAWVRVDPTRARQVLMNLLSNAIKYNRDGGTVHATVRRGDIHCHVTLVDSGPGLTTEQMSHLFEPFNRLGAERSATEGTGLGLVIARQLMLQMNGAIDISSTPGVGTTVRLTFPAAPEPEPGGQSAVTRW